jgi:hypothetical protein
LRCRPGPAGGTARQSQWIEFDAEPLKVGATLCFAQCRVTADALLRARASATFRVVSAQST